MNFATVWFQNMAKADPSFAMIPWKKGKGSKYLCIKSFEHVSKNIRKCKIYFHIANPKNIRSKTYVDVNIKHSKLFKELKKDSVYPYDITQGSKVECTIRIFKQNLQLSWDTFLIPLMELSIYDHLRS